VCAGGPGLLPVPVRGLQHQASPVYHQPLDMLLSGPTSQSINWSVDQAISKSMNGLLLKQCLYQPIASSSICRLCSKCYSWEISWRGFSFLGPASADLRSKRDLVSQGEKLTHRQPLTPRREFQGVSRVNDSMIYLLLRGTHYYMTVSFVSEK